MNPRKHDMTVMTLISTAVVMLVLLGVAHLAAPPPAVAGSMMQSGGDYVATVARLSEGQEALWVLDARTRVVGIYLYDVSTSKLELRRTLTLEAVREAVR